MMRPCVEMSINPESTEPDGPVAVGPMLDKEETMGEDVKRGRLGVFLVGAAAVMSLGIVGCVSVGVEEGVEEGICPAGFDSGVEYQLFFGLDDSEGNRVSVEDWEAFVADTITPRFPGGMTIIDVHGQWQEPDGNIQREETILVRGLIAEHGDDSLRLVDEISAEFVRRFDQDPVWRIVRDACYGFGEG